MNKYQFFPSKNDSFPGSLYFCRQESQKLLFEKHHFYCFYVSKTSALGKHLHSLKLFLLEIRRQRTPSSLQIQKLRIPIDNDQEHSTQLSKDCLTVMNNGSLYFMFLINFYLNLNDYSNNSCINYDITYHLENEDVCQRQKLCYKKTNSRRRRGKRNDETSMRHNNDGCSRKIILKQIWLNKPSKINVKSIFTFGMMFYSTRR